MKKTLPIAIVGVILVGAIGLFIGSKLGKGKEEKTLGSMAVESPVTSDNNTIANISTSEEKSEKAAAGSEEATLKQNIEKWYKEAEEQLAGTTADMANGQYDVGDKVSQEMKRLYDSLMAELPQNEKEKLRKSQEDWEKGREAVVEKRLEKEGVGGGTMDIPIRATIVEDEFEKRALELAKMYDKLHKK